MKDTGERLIEKGNEQTLTYGEHLSRYNSVLELIKGKAVLDIASGSGYGTKLMSKTARAVVGVDYSDEAVQYSRQHYKAANVTYKVGDAHQLPLDDDSVDVVVSFETIEHLKDPKKFIQEVKRVLRKDGLFIVSTPNDDEFMEGNEFHTHEFDLGELQRLIKQNFKNHDFYFQGTWFSAGLVKKETFTKPMLMSDIAVAKSFGQKIEKAIFFIVVASDGPTKALQENIVIADRWSSKEDIEREEARQADLTSLRAMEKALREKCARLEGRLKHMENTKWWKARHTAGRVRSGVIRRQRQEDKGEA